MKPTLEPVVLAEPLMHSADPYSLKSEPYNVAELASLALSHRERSGILQMLKHVANAFNSCGCILWQLAPGAGLEAPSGHLFVVGEWFQGYGGTAVYDLPLSSATGRAIRSKVPFNGDVWLPSNGVMNIDPLFKQANIQIMCSIPITFRARSHGDLAEIPGALNLYRNTNVEFSSAELADLQNFAQLIPTLYRAAWDDIIFQLSNKIEDLINSAEQRGPKLALSKNNMRRIVKGVCELVTETLRCMETSVFFEDPFKSAGAFELLATTWPGKRLTPPKKGQGLIGWVLQHERHVRIFDLASFERDRRRFYDAAYPGITYTEVDALDIQTVRELLGLKRDLRLPKLSFAAVPIVDGQQVVGAIRCSIAKEAPFYFAEREVEVLTLVATQLSRYWANWAERRRLREEVQSWHAFAESVGKLDAFVNVELTKDNLSEKRIFEEALTNTEQLIRGAEIMDVRFLHEGVLRFEATHGQAWHEGRESEIRARRQKSYPVDGSVRSVGARVFNSGKVEQLNNVHSDPDYSETFPSTKRMIIAPLKIGDAVYGVLDIRGTEDADFPGYAKAVAKLLGERLGLYCLLVRTIRGIRDKDMDLEASVTKLNNTYKQQRNVLEDLNHQLYGPITDAHGTVNDILRDEFEELIKKLKDDPLVDRLSDKLLSLRGQCGKTKRVTMSTGLFADLEIQEPEDEKLSRIRSKLKLKRMVREMRINWRNPDDICKKLIEAAKDAQSLSEKDQNIHVRVRRDTFNVLIFQDVYVDYDMLEQAIVNLLDNAFKYSHPESQIWIEGGLTHHTQRFYISITNTGIPIADDEIENCRDRGWRGKKARDATGEGSGIGLWIVDYIMRAHHGELEITCNRIDDNTGSTRIRLLFADLQVEQIPKSDLYRLIGPKTEATVRAGAH